jgi:hypothetical protein
VPKPPKNLPVTLDDLDHAPAKLPEQNNIDYATKYHDLLNQFSRVADEKVGLSEKVAVLQAANGTAAILNDLIKPYASKSFKFMCGYCSFVGLVLLLDGFSFGLTLPESVLDLLVGSTAVTVIGLVGMVLTGVFIGARKR